MDPVTDALSDFGDQLEEMLNGRSDVTDVDRVSIGILGFTLEGVGDVSLSFNKTGDAPL